MYAGNIFLQIRKHFPKSKLDDPVHVAMHVIISIDYSSDSNINTN